MNGSLSGCVQISPTKVPSNRNVYRRLTIHSSAGAVTAISTRFVLVDIIWTLRTKMAMEAMTRKLLRRRVPRVLRVQVVNSEKGNGPAVPSLLRSYTRAQRGRELHSRPLMCNTC